MLRVLGDIECSLHCGEKIALGWSEAERDASSTLGDVIQVLGGSGGGGGHLLNVHDSTIKSGLLSIFQYFMVFGRNGRRFTRKVRYSTILHINSEKYRPDLAYILDTFSL